MNPDRARDADHSPGDQRLHELLVRYFDHALSPAEAEELDRLLADEPRAEEFIEAFCLQTLATSEPPGAGARWQGPSLRRQRRWVIPVSLAAGFVLVAALFLLVQSRPSPTAARSALLARFTGEVRVHKATTGTQTRSGARIDVGDTISTVGVSASAVLAYPDGTSVVLTGDTVVTVGDSPDGRRLVVRQGVVSAEMSAEESREPFAIETEEAQTFPSLGAKLALSRRPAQTEVGVTEGHVRVTDPQGDPLMNMNGGEVATVGPDRAATKAATSRPAEEYAWDLAAPLPGGWGLGEREVGPSGAVVRPRFWNDPFIGRPACQIRSDNRWVRGLVALHPESIIRARVKADRPGRGQFLIIARPEPAIGHSCAVLQAPWPFATEANGTWQTVELRAADLVPEKPPLNFGPPWIGFLVIFNTYDSDLGLQVSEVRITRPVRP